MPAYRIADDTSGGRGFSWIDDRNSFANSDKAGARKIDYGRDVAFNSFGGYQFAETHFGVLTASRSLDRFAPGINQTA